MSTNTTSTVTSGATDSLLIDLFSEEIPARMQKTAAHDFARLLTDALKAEGLETGAAAHAETEEAQGGGGRGGGRRGRERDRRGVRDGVTSSC